MDSVWIYLFLGFIHSSLGSDCQFPPEWRGSWHDRIRTEISTTSMTHKGTCIQNEGNKYYMLYKDSSNRKCFKCLVFTQWHINLLQYKESNCWFEESFEFVCGRINVDANLHTLVRAPSSPQPCPFQGSYTFSYVNETMTSLACEDPLSEVRACADESKFKFIYKRCQGIRGTHDQEMDFQCLATWENGEKFLYGRFSEPWMTNANDYHYRCFMHSFYGTNGDMAMSADSTCQGLQYPTLGAVSMKFTKDLNQPRGSCRFPVVLVNRNKWRDLSGKWLLEVEAGLQVLRLKDRLSADGVPYVIGTRGVDTSTTKLVIKCVENTGQAETLSAHIMQTDYITYVTDDTCESGYQCVRLVKRDDNILELFLGERLNDTGDKCEERHFHDATKHLLIPDVDDSGQCSITRKGIYKYLDKASQCTGTVNIGCTTPNKIIIDTKCKDYHNRPQVSHTEKVEILQCLHSWTTDSKTYIIIQNEGQAAKCLTFFDIEVGVELQSDDSCQSDRWTVTNQNLNYVLSTPPDPCHGADIQADGGNTDDKSSDTSDPEKHQDNTISGSPVLGSALPTIVCSVVLYLMAAVR